MTPELEKMWKECWTTPSDISLHIPVLKEYASQCEHVTEFGVRWIVSTWGLLAGLPKKLTSYDMHHPSVHNARIENVYEMAENNNVDYEFILGDTTKIEIEPTELLFIDTDHTYEHLKKELDLHASKVSKWIILHDTISFPEMTKAAYDFIENSSEWEIERHVTDDINDGVGLMVIKRI